MHYISTAIAKSFENYTNILQNVNYVNLIPQKNIFTAN